jgi:GNAT superfamily N-acetyltransferase
MIRVCTKADVSEILGVINEAARAYHGVIPPESYHEPYMTERELREEIDAGVVFSCLVEDESLAGVMGLQDMGEVGLIRHAYVRQSHQRQGIGGALLSALSARTSLPLLVGTWAAAMWAIEFYTRHGFRLLSTDEGNRLLQRYWAIPDGQREHSVVLASSSTVFGLAP